MRISDWSSDVCSSDLPGRVALDPDYECRASEIDAASVLLPVTVTRRVGAFAAADFRGGCRFRDRLFGLPGSGGLGRFAYHSGVSQLLLSTSRSRFGQVAGPAHRIGQLPGKANIRRARTPPRPHAQPAWETACGGTRCARPARS